MSINHSPSVVTSGLVLYADMSNTQKSWKGAPTVNLYTDPSFATGSPHPVNGGGAVVADPRNSTNKVLKFSPSGGNQYNGRDIPVTLSSVYSYQMEMFVSSDFNGTDFRMYPEQAGGGAGASYDLTKKGTWQTLKYNGRVASTTNFRMLCYVLSAFTTGYAMFTNVQVEQNAFVTPFVNGTRSNTQSIVDLTGNNTITVNSLTYASDNTFSFNGSNSFTFANPLLAQANAGQEWSVIGWVNINTTANQLLLTGINNGLYLTTGSNTTLLYLNSGANDYYTYGTAVGGAGWCQVAYRFKNSTGARTIYKNGVNISTSGPNNTSTPAGNSGTLTLGSSTNGSIGTTMIYNRYITDAELMQNFNALRGRYGI